MVKAIIHKIESIIEKFFFKKRYLLLSDLRLYSVKDANNPFYIVTKINKNDLIKDGRIVNHKCFNFLSNKIGYNKLINLLNNINCSLFLAIEKDTLEPAGFYWVMIPKNNCIWHDNFCVKPGSALAFNAYVDDAHRRRGVYSLLIVTIHNYLYQYNLCQYVYTIVEKNNLYSLKANIKFGLKIDKKNYLMKLFKRNIFSVYFGNKEKEIFYVFKNSRDQNL